ncbi:hypothetical protein LIOPPNJA_26805, partial [Robbsia andropogonis]|nr:hypothetical protein [Robbsia andropogonis]MCP1131357.1 hypothetical protein [Robbsia andropogonis]
QATAAARAMADQAQALRDSVAIFRVGADASASPIGHQSSIAEDSISHNYRHTSRQGKALRRAA